MARGRGYVDCCLAVLVFVGGHSLGQPESHHSFLNTIPINSIPLHPSTQNADLRNLPCGQLLSQFIDKCAAAGVLVMLDMHRLNELEIPELVRFCEPHAHIHIPHTHTRLLSWLSSSLWVDGECAVSLLPRSLRSLYAIFTLSPLSPLYLYHKRLSTFISL